MKRTTVLYTAVTLRRARDAPPRAPRPRRAAVHFDFGELDVWGSVNGVWHTPPGPAEGRNSLEPAPLRHPDKTQESKKWYI